MLQKNQATVSKARRDRERAEMTAQIKDIAREMFVRDGYEAVTLQKIAAVLEYTTPAIYRYFKDKKELLREIVLEDMAELHAQLLECTEIEGPLEQVTEMARRNTLWAVTHPNHYLLFYSRAWMDQEDAVRQEQNTPLQQEPLFILFNAVDQAIEQGLLREEFTDPALVTRALFAAVHGIIMLEITMSNYDKSLIHDQDASRPFLQSFETMISALKNGMLKNPR